MCGFKIGMKSVGVNRGRYYKYVGILHIYLHWIYVKIQIAYAEYVGWYIGNLGYINIIKALT